jgi:hypothetical protein
MDFGIFIMVSMGVLVQARQAFSPLYHAVFYTNTTTTLGMNRLFCFSQVPLYCVDPMQLSLHYIIIVLVYLSLTFVLTHLTLVGDGFSSLSLYTIF